MTQTELEEAELAARIGDFYRSLGRPREGFDLGRLRQFLVSNLRFLPRAMETTRPIQVYWTLAPLFKACELVGADPRVELGDVIEQVKATLLPSFRQRPYHHPHIMAAFATCMVYKLIGYEHPDPL